MEPSKFHIRVLSEPDEVVPFVEWARGASDEEKDALGFLPESVFREAAYQGKLLVAVAPAEDRTPAFAGYLLHGGAFPHAKIFQLLAVPQFRGRGVGRLLVETLVRRSEEAQFMSVQARVADDLPANAFWERMGFGVARTVAGGRTTGRRINVRVRELDTPNLFRPAASFASAREPQIETRISNASPVYVLDLNVVFDLLKRRANAESVGRIVRASLNNRIRLAVTEELLGELRRSSIPSPTDPVLELAVNLPQLPRPAASVLAEVLPALGALVFPDDLARGHLRTQDRSDLIHLATAIHHRAAGFVTSEKAILRTHRQLFTRYGLDVIGPSELAGTVEPTPVRDERQILTMLGGAGVEGRQVQDSDIWRVEEFLLRLGCTSQLAREWLSITPDGPRHRMLVRSQGDVVAFGAWESPSGVRPAVRSFLCVDEDHTAAGLSSDFLLDSMARDAARDFPSLVCLQLVPGHVATRGVAAAHGFRPPVDEPSRTTFLQKIALGCVLRTKNWDHVRQRLKAAAGIELPQDALPYESPEQRIAVRDAGGRVCALRLEDLEVQLSPAIIALPGRPGIIAPIRKAYAEELVGLPGRSLSLISPEASMLRERVYFSNPRTLGVLTRGAPIFFYESMRRGGSGSVIAVGRVARVELCSKERASGSLLGRGVLSEEGLRRICKGDKVVATAVDNIIPFKSPVQLWQLRAIGAVDGANLVTARALVGAQVSRIIEEGLP